MFFAMGLFAKQPAPREQNFIVPSSFSALPFYSVIKIIDTLFYSDRMRRTSPPQPFLCREGEGGGEPEGGSIPSK